MDGLRRGFGLWEFDGFLGRCQIFAALTTITIGTTICPPSCGTRS